jgi:hypothetical protein
MYFKLNLWFLHSTRLESWGEKNYKNALLKKILQGYRKIFHFYRSETVFKKYPFSNRISDQKNIEFDISSFTFYRKSWKTKSIHSIKQTTRRLLIKDVFKSSVSLFLPSILILQIKNFLRHFMMVVMALNSFFFVRATLLIIKKSYSILLICNKNLWNSLIYIDFQKVCFLYKTK